MRIISGRLKGKRLVSIRGFGIRPTSDKVKESIFDILGNEFVGSTVLDLFAGTGSLGIEALSRWAKKAVFVDIHPHAIGVIRKNLAYLDLQEYAYVFKRNPLKGLRFLKDRNFCFDLVFLDPPYGKKLVEKVLKRISESGIIRSSTTLVAEHSQTELVTSEIGSLALKDQRRYGRTMVSFFFVR